MVLCYPRVINIAMAEWISIFSSQKLPSLSLSQQGTFSLIPWKRPKAMGKAFYCQVLLKGLKVMGKALYCPVPWKGLKAVGKALYCPVPWKGLKAVGKALYCPVPRK